jgi:pimeloyl-ACP methyl ester carboxylesterase
MLHDANCVDAQALMLHACSSNATRYRSKAISQDAQLSDILSQYEGDLLLVWGEQDVTAVPEVIGPLLLDGRSNRHLEIVADSGHWVQYEHSEQTNRMLVNWFQNSISQET